MNPVRDRFATESIDMRFAKDNVVIFYEEAPASYGEAFLSLTG